MKSNIVENDRILQSFTLLFEKEIDEDNIYDQIYEKYLKIAFEIYISSHHNIKKPASPTVRKLFSSQFFQLVNFINENLHRKITLTDLARVVKISQSTLVRIFNEYTGTSPLQYVLACRIERAKKLLQEENLSIVEVATQTGFYDQSRFTNNFKKQTGMTPKQFILNRKHAKTCLAQHINGAMTENSG